MAVQVALNQAQIAVRALAPALTGPSADGRVLVRSAGDRLQLSTYHQDSALTVSMSTSEGASEDCVVSGRLVTDFIAGAAGRELSITVYNGRFLAHAGEGKLDIPSYPVDTWHAISHVHENHTQWAAEVPQLLTRVIHAADPSTTGIMSGVSFRSGMACATDSHRISAVELPLDQNVEVVVPATALATVARLHEDSPVEVCATDRHMTFRGTGWEFTTNLMEGVFPNWRAHIPDPAPPCLLAYKDQLLEALHRIKALAGKDELHKIQITSLDGDLLQIWAELPDVGRQEELVEGTFELTQAAFNLGNLTRAVQHLHKDAIEIEMANPLAPAVLRGDGYLAVVMPIRN